MVHEGKEYPGRRLFFGGLVKMKIKAKKVLKAILLAGVFASVSLPGLFSCARNNPLDEKGSDYVAGKKPEAQFLRDSIVAYIRNDIAIPVFYHDSAAVGGRTPRVTALLLNWEGDSNSLFDTVTPPENDSLVKYFSEGMASYIYMRALDNDDSLSLLAKMWLRIDEGKPRILSLVAHQQTPYVGDTVTVTANATDDNAETGESLDFIWSIDNFQYTSTRSGVLKVVFSSAGDHKVALQVRDNDSILSLPDSVMIEVYTIPQVVDTIGPEIIFSSPADGDTVTIPFVTVSVLTRDPSGVRRLLINNVSADLAGGTEFDCAWLKDSVFLAVGSNVLPLLAIDNRGNISQRSLRISYNKNANDKTPPVIVPFSPKSGDTVYFHSISVIADVYDASSTVDSVKCNGLPMVHSGSSMYSIDSIELNEGLDTITITAQDDKGNQASLDLFVFYKKETIIDTIPPSVLILSPRTGAAISIRACTVSVAALDQVSGIDSVTVNGLRALHVGGQLFARLIQLAHGANTIVAGAVDKSGNRRTDTVRVVQNAAPTFTGSVKDMSLILGTEASITVSAADGDSDSLIFSFLTLPKKTATLPVLTQRSGSATIESYKPDQPGIDSFNLLVTDPFAGFDTMTIRVFISSPQETKPFFTTEAGDLPDSATVGVVYAAQLAAVDPKNKKLAFSFGKPPTPQGAQIDSQGRIAWTPEPADTGTDSLYALVSDGTESDTLIWTVQVIMPNLPPRLVDPADTAINEGQALTITLKAIDPNNDNLAYSMASFPMGAQLAGNVFSWTPTFKQAGTFSILFRVRETDRTPPLADSQTATVTVRNVNHAPVLAPIDAKTVAERDTLAFTLSASDTNGDSIRFTMANPPQGATIAPLSMTTARFSWAPTGSQAGGYSVRFIVSDNGIPGMSDTEDVAITVRDTTIPAFLTHPDSVTDTVFVGNGYLDTVRADDADGDALIYFKLSGPAWLSVTTNGNFAAVSGSPSTSDVTAGVAVSVTVEDPSGCKDTLSWTITVMPLWPRVWGAPGTQDTGFSVIEVSDGYALCGNVGVTAQNALEPLFIRTDVKGNPTVFKSFIAGGSKRRVYSIAQAPDGGFVLCGADSSAVGKMALVKVTASGDTVWSMQYGPANGADVVTAGAAVCATREGGFVMCGLSARRTGTISSAAYVVKTNSAGKEEWQKEYADNTLGNSAAYCVVQTADDGYILCGEAASKGGALTDTNVLLIKTDAKGDTLWTRTFNLGARDIGMSVQQVTDGYLVGGYTASVQSSAKTGFVMKISEKGDTLWTRPIISTSGNLMITSVRKTNDGGFIAAGSADNDISDGEDALLIKFTADGRGEEWRKMYGGLLGDGANAVAALKNGGFVFTGFTTRTISSATSTDIYLVKTDEAGTIIEK
jgi:hypothetical protein